MDESAMDGKSEAEDSLASILNALGFQSTFVMATLAGDETKDIPYVEDWYGDLRHFDELVETVRAERISKRSRGTTWSKRRYGIKKHGLSVPQYTTMLKSQGSRCAICGKRTKPSSAEDKTRPCIDHCHKTGVIRGLLCSSCNSVLGFAYDRIETLAAAITYLKKAQGLPATEEPCVERFFDDEDGWDSAWQG